MAANIHQRLHAVMQKCDYLQREKKAGMQYKIVSHDAVTAYVRPVLVENGVIYYPVTLTRTQDGNRTEIDLTLRFVNIDEPTDFIDVVGCGYGVDAQDKGPGKAISYAVKYCLLKALGLETGDDPDVDQGEETTHKPAVKVYPQQKPEPEVSPQQNTANAIKAEIDGAEDLLALNAAMTQRGHLSSDKPPRVGSDLEFVRLASEKGYAFLIDRANKRRTMLMNAPSEQRKAS